MTMLPGDQDFPPDEVLKHVNGVHPDSGEEFDDYSALRLSLPETAFVAEAGALAVKCWGDDASRRVVSTYVEQLRRGESIYAYPPGGWDYVRKQ